MTVTIACVNAGNYQGRGVEYVSNLAAMIRRNVTVPYRFVCLTDDEDSSYLDDGIETINLPERRMGWWAKLYLFVPGLFDNGVRVFYLDLDTLIIANIDDLASYDGPFAGLGCFRAHRLFASGFMAWPAGSVDHIWTDWIRQGRPMPGNADDVWIDQVCPHAVRLQRKFSGIVSYKFHKCKDGPPKGARIVVFQRQPKPHNCGSEWVSRVWQST